ncbi:MAG: type II secretion system GspH family protein [bacterium]|nr:type II secretion system GspH family protein [bacterium]
MIKNEQGFTLIEILVVIAIVGVLTGITSDIFIQIVRGSNKANVVTEIKQNGDNVLNQLERTIRNAEEITAMGGSNTSWTTVSTSVPWIDVSSVVSPYTWTCATKYCAIILKNQGAAGGYSKIEIHAQTLSGSTVIGDQKCNSTPFTTNDQDQTKSPYECNGNIRIVTDTSSDPVAILKNGTDDVNASSIGQVITNTERRSGVSVRANTAADPFFTIKFNASSPTLVTTQFALTQGISASSRVDSQAIIPFASTISLRVYNSD